MIPERRVLVVNKMHSSIEQMLREVDWEVDYRPAITEEELISIIDQYQGLIVRSKVVVDKAFIDRASQLQFLARAGAGLDQIDISALEKRGIALINAPEGNRTALGEHAVGLLLSLLHKINKSAYEVKKGQWRREPNRGIELNGKTVGIYGYGFMGSAFGEKLAGFGCRVIAYDKYKENFGTRQVQEVSLTHFEQETEILSLHVPLTSETRQYFSMEYLKKFPKLKFIINTSRGEVLSSKGVLNLLEEGQLLGAGLDVLENEKLSDLTADEREVFEALAHREDVIITPHIAGWTEESYVRINEVIVKKLVELGLGRHLASTSKN